jgi:hypothetical protein
MRISTLALSAALLTLVGFQAPAFAQATPDVVVSATSATDNAKVIESYKKNDYNMYVAATGGTSNDAVHVQFNKERNAYLADNQTVPASVETTTSGTTDEAMKIRSYMDNDYNMYVKATGGVSNDEVHVRFNKERNAYLGNKGVQPATETPAVIPVDQTQTVKPGVRTKPNKPLYNNRGNRKVEMKKSTSGSNRGKIIINLYFN